MTRNHSNNDEKRFIDVFLLSFQTHSLIEAKFSLIEKNTLSISQINSVWVKMRLYRCGNSSATVDLRKCASEFVDVWVSASKGRFWFRSQKLWRVVKKREESSERNAIL